MMENASKSISKPTNQKPKPKKAKTRPNSKNVVPITSDLDDLAEPKASSTTITDDKDTKDTREVTLDSQTVVVNYDCGQPENDDPALKDELESYKIDYKQHEKDERDHTDVIEPEENNDEFFRKVANQLAKVRHLVENLLSKKPLSDREVLSILNALGAHSKKHGGTHNNTLVSFGEDYSTRATIIKPHKNSRRFTNINKLLDIFMEAGITEPEQLWPN
jgi:hypothetical protein